MPYYLFEGKDKSGNIVRGKVRGKTDEAVAALLKSKGIIPTKMEKPRGFYDVILGLFGQVTPKDKIIATNQLFEMIASGLALEECIKILSEETRNRYFRKIWAEIGKDLENGLSFYAAMSKYPKVFSPIYLAMVQTGERSGKLDVVLKQLAQDLEKEAEITDTIRGAIIYPVVIVFFLLLAVAFLTFLVAPQVEQLFRLSKVEIPNTTQAIINISSFLVSYWPSVVIFLMFVVLAFYVLFKSKTGKKIGDRLILALPVIRRISQLANMERFTRTLSILLSAGIGILDAFQLASLATGNQVVASAIRAASTEIERGTPLSEALKMQKIFPDTVYEMVSVGEETGRVDSVLTSLSEMYKREVNDSVKSLLSVIEPALLVILGAGIGFFIFSVLLPLYNVSRL